MTNVNRILTSGDFSTLSRLVEDWHAAGYALAPLARKIVGHARVVFPSDLPPDVASLGSRLEYSGDGKRSTAELTALVLMERDCLPVRDPVGLGLLGRREGEEFEVVKRDAILARVVVATDKPRVVRDRDPSRRHQGPHLGVVGHLGEGPRVRAPWAAAAGATVVG